VRQHAPAEDVHPPRAHDKIPQEVSKPKTLAQSAQPRVSPKALLPALLGAPRLAVIVGEDDVEGEGADDDGLEEADDVHIPANAGAVAEGAVVLGDIGHARAEEGRDDDADEGVKGEGKEDLVRVDGQAGKRELLRQRPHERNEGLWW